MTDAITCEVEVIPGLETMVANDLAARFRRQIEVGAVEREGLLPIVYRGELAALLDLDLALAVYGQRWFPIPRPKALLGNAEFDVLLSMINLVRALQPDSFHTFRLSAAGEDSTVMVRLRERIAAATGLEFTAEEGDLLIRMRRPLDGSAGWDVLIRLSARPLSVRPWRVCNLAGALNASVAQAMVRLSRPHADDVVLNLGCGSGTLLIERRAHGPARLALGCDTDADALACAAANVAASRLGPLHLFDWDGGATPLPDGAVDSVLADLPFGQLVGSHARNVRLYPRLLREAARVTVGGGTLVALTQDMRLWEGVVANSPEWRTAAVWPIKMPFGSGYLHPRIYVLERA